jgi:hypothetical protein
MIYVFWSLMQTIDFIMMFIHNLYLDMLEILDTIILS